MRRRARWLAMVGMLALASALMIGQAVGDVRVAEHQFQIDEPASSDGWRELPASERGDAADVLIVAGYHHAGSGAVLAITRMAIANPRAWDDDDDDFFAEVEAGIESTSARYQRFHRRQQRVNKVPALDLGFRRDSERGREVVLMRFLFFRRYTLALALRVPAPAHRRHERAFRALLESFAPYLGPP